MSRRAAQQEVRTPGRVRGVIAINSPHRGAPLPTYTMPFVRGLFQAMAFPFKASLCPTRKRGCGEVEAMTAGHSPVQQLYEFTRDNLGVAQQMTADAPFRTELEIPSEPFLRVGIVSHAWEKWLWMRMAADMNCEPDAGCGGRQAAKRTARFYKHLKKSTLVNGLLAVGSALSFNGPGAVVFGATAAKDGGLMLVLALTEVVYRKYVAGGTDSDGVVPASSQAYPGVSAQQQFHIRNADSHVGSTKSNLVRDQLVIVLSRPELFNLP